MKFILLILIASSTTLLGQVGINNTDPKATLDITSSNIATPSNTDGLLIPRVDEFPVIDPTIEQDGMMVFATGNGAPMKGFYFWNHGTTAWEGIAPASSNANWYEVGTTNVANDINDDIYTLGSLSLGINAASPSAQIYMQSNSDDENFNVYSTFTGANSSTITSLYSTSTLSGTGGFEGARNDIGGSNSGTIYALRNQFSNTGTGQKIGLQNNFASLPGTHKGVVNAFTAGTGVSMGLENVSPGAFTIDGALYGVRNSLESLGNGQRYGVQTIINSTGPGTKYGEHIVINTAAGGLHYGIYSDVQKTSGYAGYFVGRTSFGTNPSSNRYRLPETDGTSGQVMTTDGAGQISFSTPSTGAEKIDDLTDAKSDNDGTDDGSSIFLGVGAGAGDDSSDNRNVGIGYEALMTNTNVGLNVAVGYQALRTANTANNRSTAIGYQSMMANTIGADNVALGLWSLFSNTDGDYNTSIGARSLISHTNGNRNTVIGYEAGESLTSGDGNILIGYQAADNATVLNDKLFIESSGGVTPLIYGEFDNDMLQINGELQVGNPSGTGYAFPTIDGAAGQVLISNGAGQVSFSTPTTGAERINDLQDGKSDNDGTDNGSSVFLGLNAGQNDDSSNNQNVGIGYSALNANTTGIGNSAFGYTALQSNTTSSFHTAIGHQSLSNINGGSGNVGVGYRSLFTSSSSSDNVGIGTRALELTTSGGNNVAIGSVALANNTVGIRNVSVGRNALEDNVSGNRNIAIGYNAGSSNTGSSNVFLGNESGANQTTSNNKLFIENTDADENSALLYGDFGTDSSTSGNILRTNSQFQIGNPSSTGYAFPAIDGAAGQVLITNGTGQVSFSTPTTGAERINDLIDGKSDNDGSEDGSSIFLGINAGTSDNGTDNQNVGIGYNATQANTSGERNVALGYTALYNNTAGDTNTAIGFSALYSNLTGSNNIAMGGNALVFNSTGDDNIAIGSSAMFFNTTGANNIAIGESTLRDNTIGVNNIALGYRSLYNLTSGNENVSIGAEAGFTNTTGIGNVYLGNDAGRSHIGNNTLWIENTNANEDNALIYGEFDNDILRTNGELQIGNPAGAGYALPTTDGTVGQVMTTNGTGSISFQTITGDGDTQNTLDEAYDEGGPGAGSNIIADNGAVTIAGQDGLTVTGTINNGDLIAVTGAGTRMFFNPRTGSFRAGTVNGTQWNNTNLGNNSMAFGSNNIASGGASTALGTANTSSGTASASIGSGNIASGGHSVTLNQNNTTSGLNSFAQGFGNTSSANASSAMGLNNTAPSWAEMTVGANATTYAATDASTWVGTDRVFTVGNGAGPTLRSNALTVYKNGEININDAYSLPTVDGTIGQIMTTDGSGNVTFEDAVDTDNQQIDTFNFNSSTNVLTLEIEDDAQPAQTVDLSSLNPTKAVARITLSANQTESGLGITKVNFDTEDFDIGNNFNLITDEFEAPVNGIYRVHAQISMSSSTSTGTFDVRIRVDGSQVRRTAFDHTGNGVVTRQTTSLLELTAGQVIDIAFLRPSTGATIVANNTLSYFEIEQL